MSLQGPQPDAVEAAEAWFARMRAGALTSAEQVAFDRWLSQDDSNRAEFDRVTRTWAGMEAVRADPAVLTMREQALARAGDRTRQMTRRAALAAAVIGAVGLSAWGIQQGARWRTTVAQENAVNYETRVGQKSTITLPDGSLVVLDTDSALEAWSTQKERRIRLMRGRAFFNVAKDRARPFSVSAGRNTVTALGTEFDVELKPASMEVTLVSGRLRVHGGTGAGTGTGTGELAAPAAVVEMSSGQRLIATHNRPWTMRQADSRIDTGWLRGQLVFDEETLGNIATALNRYSNKKIVIPDPQVANRRLSAVLVAGDIDTFVQAADTLGLARASLNDPRRVELVAP